MGAYRVYGTGVIFATATGVQVQETGVALFPVRSVLLRDDPEFHLHLVSSVESGAICSVLLPIAWIASECGDHVEE